MTEPKKPMSAATKGGIIAAAVAAVAGFTTVWEGVELRPYRDPVGIKTVCIGETQNIQDRIYSREECAGLLRRRMAQDYAPRVLACVPAFAEPKRMPMFQAAIDASYNAGPAAFCRSPMARLFNAGEWAKGCDAFVGWYVTARGVRLRGLVRRREAERVLCWKGLVA